MRNEKRFLRTLKRDIKRTGNRKRRRFLKNIDASPEDFDLGRDRTDVMNERPREKPKRWVTASVFWPGRPRLVVMMTTPLAAFEPYRAAAEAPLRTSTFAMSFGLRSAMRLTGLSWVDALPPAAAAVSAFVPDGIATFEMITPSIT